MKKSKTKVTSQEAPKKSSYLTEEWFEERLISLKDGNIVKNGFQKYSDEPNRHDYRYFVFESTTKDGKTFENETIITWEKNLSEEADENGNNKFWYKIDFIKHETFPNVQRTEMKFDYNLSIRKFKKLAAIVGIKFEDNEND